MQIFKEITPLKGFLKELRRQGKSIGAVPTMGALHAGHLALIRASQLQNQITVCTVFVNPTQFNNPADLQKYPRTLDKDIKLLEEVRCDVLFCPETHEIYPEPATVSLDFGKLDKVMEGEFRPGHFSGVALIVSKLFHIVQPDYAYFGQKDWQQVAIIKALVKQLNFDLTIISVPTLREPDGLALSSRNLRLTSEQRQHATVFYRALSESKKLLTSGRTIAAARQLVNEMLQKEPGVRLEYFEVADSVNLNRLENVEEANRPVLCIAGYVGEVRLIDNMFLTDQH